MQQEQTGQSRSPRSDAVRNRQAILDAAQGLTATAGTDVNVQDVARAAGVAVGTLYRHWPTKEDLLASVLLRRLDHVAADAEVAPSLEHFIAAVTELCVVDPPLLQLLDVTRARPSPRRQEQEPPEQASTPTEPGHAAVQDRLDRAVGHLIDRARQAGQLRHDIKPRDLRIYLIGVRAAMSSDDHDAWKRYYAIYRDGLFRHPLAERAHE